MRLNRAQRRKLARQQKGPPPTPKSLALRRALAELPEWNKLRSP